MVLDRISTGPVKLVDIRDTIIEFGGEAGNDCVSYFQNNDVNKWAKYKDVKYRADFPPYDGDWWKADDGCCGFDKNSILFNDTDSLIAAYNDNTTYIYTPPIGGIYEPLRLGDFRGYTYKAAAPIWDFYVHGAFLNQDGAITGSIDCELHSNHSGIDSQYNLVLGDITNMADDVQNWYFGCIIVNSDGKTFTKSHEDSIGSGEEIVNDTFTVESSELGFIPTKYKVYPCLMERRPQQGNGTGRVMAVPCAANKGSGGNFVGGVYGETVIEVPAVGWVGNVYWYQGRRGLIFRGTIGYRASLDGSEASIEIEFYNKNGLNTTREYDITLAYTEVHDEDTYYMDYEQEIIISNEGYEEEEGGSIMISITGGSNMVTSRTQARYGGTDNPLEDER